MVILKNIIAFETNILSFVKFQVKLKSLKFGSTVVLFEIRTFDFLKVENIHLKPKKFGSKAPIIWVHLGCIYGLFPEFYFLNFSATRETAHL